MANPYVGEIRLVSFNFAPEGWSLCNGQLIAISQNAALFALLGTNYGGNGTENFALPNLQGATPIHFGVAVDSTNYTIGETGGEVNVTLSSAEMPSHTHQANGVSTVADLEPATGNAWADSAQNPYAASGNTSMSSSSVGNAGGSLSHNNMPPYLVMNFIIALAGIFPSQN
jgi:microcystin-dependent protein